MIYDDGIASSPDPLASPSLEHGPRPKISPKKPLADTSNNLRRREFCLTTPPRYANGHATPFQIVAEAENPISPWCIRVTVQAEQSGKGDDFVFGRIAGGTAAKRVPLKTADHGLAASIPKNGQGAAQKSPKQKRAVAARKATPTSAKGLVEEQNQENISPTKRLRGRPRKSTQDHAEGPEKSLNKETAEFVDAFSGVEIEAPQKSRLRSRGRSKVISPTVSDSGSPSRDGHRPHGVNAKPTGATDDSVEVGFRSHVLDPTSEHDEFDSILESEGFSMVSVSSLSSAKPCLDNLAEFDERFDYYSSNLIESSFADALESDEKPGYSPLNTNIKINDPQENAETQESPPHCSRELISDRGSRPNLTPLKIPSKTLIPPVIIAPKTSNSPRPLEKPSDGTPRLVRVVRAGIALQGVLSPRGKSAVDSAETDIPPSSTPVKSPIERLDSLFGGFGAGTCRELRAGLRLGEQLAKRQQLLPQRTVAELQTEDDVFAQGKVPSSFKPSEYEMGLVYTLKLPKHGQSDLFPNKQLPSPERSEIDKDEGGMSWRLDTSEGARLANTRIGNRSTPTVTDQIFEGSTIAREEEEYRLERAAVSREIEEANASQVIVINSDSEGDENDHDEHDIDDIWNEHAMSGLTSQPIPNAVVSTQLQNPKPRRSQIPSPWRRHGHISSDIQGAADDTDLFWQLSQTTNSSEIHEELSSECSYPDLSRSIPLDLNKGHDDRPSIDAKDVEIFSCNTDKARVEDFSAQDCIPAAMSPLLQLPQSVTVASKLADVLASPIKKTIDDRSPVQKQAPTSWLGYLKSFVPAFREPIPLIAPNAEHRLPNGKRKLPHAGSLDGPLSRFTPWTEAHFRALYFHYAASIECRQRYVFNPESASARYAGRMIEWRGWERAITKDDCAIVDAFMLDLNRRGSSFLQECGDGETRINESLATKMVFILWMGGVKRGECDVGTGKTGLADGSDEVIWRPELESWFKEVEKQRSRKLK